MTNHSDRWSGWLVLRRRPGTGGVYEVRQQLDFFGRQLHVRVSPGLLTDGASVPRFLWWWGDPFVGAYTAAAVLHDGLYAAQHTSRREADALLLEAMLDSEVRPTQAYAFWLGVRLGGWLPWNRYRKDPANVQGARNHVFVRRRPPLTSEVYVDDFCFQPA